jgi:hypothetical protein
MGSWSSMAASFMFSGYLVQWDAILGTLPFSPERRATVKRESVIGYPRGWSAR